jgi:outer membrane lipoprotein-sorting protein
MRRLLVLGIFITATAAPAARAADAAKGGLTAAQIADRNVRARGGLAAWQGIETIQMSGELEAGGKTDAKLPFVLSMKRPHKSRLEIKFAGRDAVQTYDGVHGWKLRPYLNRDDVEPFTAAEARSAADSSELDGPLVGYAKKGTQIELAGTEKIEGRRTYKLKLVRKDEAPRFVWVDATTFLETKISGEPRKLDGRPHDVAIFLRDYRTVKGVKVPYVLETVVKGVKEHYKMTFKSVTVNPPLDDALFAKPSVKVAKASGR